ncbi:MAG: BspA family leucine-rich repeat surface protein, partial [Erysipelotrichaceae bacterium]|nr:BspA family leucine-rich repeat surface protein [Erysipelotrichaceae bacterium]
MKRKILKLLTSTALMVPQTGAVVLANSNTSDAETAAHTEPAADGNPQKPNLPEAETGSEHQNESAETEKESEPAQKNETEKTETAAEAVQEPVKAEPAVLEKEERTEEEAEKDEEENTGKASGFRIPSNALASGKNGVQWYVSQDGTLHIQAGTMTSRFSMDDALRPVITRVEVIPEGSKTKVVLPADSSYFFVGFSGLTAFDLSSFDTSNVTNMKGMFNSCSSLTDLNVSVFDTRNVTDMSYMFVGCSSLPSLDLSSFHTPNLEWMGMMFAECPSLESLNLSNFDTSKITIMEYLFSNCKSLKTLDLSSFSTASVLSMNGMFENCSSLESVNLSSFNASKVKYLSEMFANCHSLRSLDLSSFHPVNAEYMNSMFRSCWNLTSINLSGFDTRSAVDMSGMFTSCAQLTDLDLSSFSTGKVEKMAGMFSDCASLISLDVTSFDTSNVTDMDSMFWNCPGLKTLDLSSFNTRNAANMSSMFFNCSNLKELNVSSFDTYRLADSSNMFAGMSSLERINLSEGFFNSRLMADTMPHNAKTLWQKETAPNTLKTWPQMAAAWSDSDAGWWSTAVETCVLTFETNGGSRVPSETVKKGETVLVCRWTPEKAGYEFTGWYLDPECTQKAAEQLVLDSDRTVYAGWKAEKVTLDFNSMGGTNLDPVTVKNGSKVNLDDYRPEKKGYVFAGWFTDENCQNAADSLYTVTANTVLYAGWAHVNNLLTFETNGGSELAPVKGVFGEAIDLSQYVPVKEGFDFDGWYTDASLETPAENPFILHIDTTVYAKWTEAKKTVSFNTNGGSDLSDK